jgi:hypothetical protein
MQYLPPPPSPPPRQQENIKSFYALHLRYLYIMLISLGKLNNGGRSYKHLRRCWAAANSAHFPYSYRQSLHADSLFCSSCRRQSPFKGLVFVLHRLPPEATSWSRGCLLSQCFLKPFRNLLLSSRSICVCAHRSAEILKGTWQWTTFSDVFA